MQKQSLIYAPYSSNRSMKYDDLVCFWKWHTASHTASTKLLRVGVARKLTAPLGNLEGDACSFFFFFFFWSYGMKGIEGDLMESQLLTTLLRLNAAPASPS